MHIVHNKAMKTVCEVNQVGIKAKELLGEESFNALVVVLATNPAEGDLITGTGGFRKMRWARGNKGKSGGVRVIYFDATHTVYWVLVYAKGQQDTFSAQEKNILKEIAKTFH